MVHGLDDSRPRRQQQQPAANNDGNFTGVQHGPGTIPSKSFQRLQQMTSPGDIDTASIRPPTEEGYQVGNYDETSIRYLGRTNPSKSFKMLQNMTGGNELDVPTTHRRRERKQVQPNSPEQNPDDTVDIRFVGSNIPSRSFQKLQSMVPASPENDPSSVPLATPTRVKVGQSGSRTVKVIKLRSQSETPPPSADHNVSDY